MNFLSVIRTLGAPRAIGQAKRLTMTRIEYRMIVWNNFLVAFMYNNICEVKSNG